MTTIVPAAPAAKDVALLAETTTTHTLHPRYEGSNICTWIGFKHVNYMVEEAVLDRFRQLGFPARSLYERNGLCVEFVAMDTRIGSAFHMDDTVSATVTPAKRRGENEFRFAVNLHTVRGDNNVKAAASTVTVVLRTDHRGGAPAEPIDDALRAYVRADLRRAATEPSEPPVVNPRALGRGGIGGDEVLAELTRGTNSFAWRWRIPYPYCHFTERLQMSGYLRQMEEVVDLFLAARGISIKRLLDEQNWIPVVPRSNVTILDEALMEEDLYTVFTVEDVFKKSTYTARMDCYVLRDGVLVQTATGRITHGYAVIESRSDWSLVEFDERMLRGLHG